MRIPDGAYAMRRTGGLLPSLRSVGKEVAGGGGSTVGRRWPDVATGASR